MSNVINSFFKHNRQTLPLSVKRPSGKLSRSQDPSPEPTGHDSVLHSKRGVMTLRRPSSIVVSPGSSRRQLPRLSKLPSIHNESKVQKEGQDIDEMPNIKSQISKMFSRVIFDPYGDISTRTRLALKLIEMAMDYHKKHQSESVILVLEEIENSCLTAQPSSVIIHFYKSYLTILLELSEYTKSSKVAEKLLNESGRSEDYESLIFGFERAGDAFSKLKNYEEALRNYFMMLKVSLKSFNYRKELESYDKIGLQYFLVNRLDYSEYFHNKMVEGEIEPDNSNLRTLPFVLPGIVIHSSNPEDSEPDLNDLAMIFFKPMAVDSKYQVSQRKLRVLEYMDELANPVRRVGNVKVYSSDAAMDKVVRSGYTRKPTNCPLSSLAHLSANRSLKVFDAMSGVDDQNTFRFMKYGRNFSILNKKGIMQALQELRSTFADCQNRLFRGSADGVKSTILPSPATTTAI